MAMTPVQRKVLKLAVFGLAALAFSIGKFFFDLYRVARLPVPTHATPAPGTTAARLKIHVDALATKIGERNFSRPTALESAARYIESELRTAGYDVISSCYSVQANGSVAWTRNIEVHVAGESKDAPLLIVGAHYDTASETPGADDNASGVSALLELARRLKGERRAAEIRLVAFGTEEPPYFGTADMGSARYVQSLDLSGRNLIGMVSLECLGFFHELPNSQKYPPILGWFYPDKANFIGFVSNIASRQLLGQFKEAYRASERTPAVFAALPQYLVSTITLSDQVAFWSRGHPAIMVSDTAFLRNSSYHQTSDRSDRIDYERFAEVVEGLDQAIGVVAGKFPELDELSMTDR